MADSYRDAAVIHAGYFSKGFLSTEGQVDLVNKPHSGFAASSHSAINPDRRGANLFLARYASTWKRASLWDIGIPDFEFFGVRKCFMGVSCFGERSRG